MIFTSLSEKEKVHLQRDEPKNPQPLLQASSNAFSLYGEKDRRRLLEISATLLRGDKQHRTTAVSHQTTAL